MSFSEKTLSHSLKLLSLLGSRASGWSIVRNGAFGDVAQWPDSGSFGDASCIEAERGASTQ
jgi:hypothetical protein